jgi:hypothetical protein
MPFWTLAIPFAVLAVYDYSCAAREADPFRVRLRRWRARGAVLSAVSALLAYVPGLVIRFTTAHAWRQYGGMDELWLVLLVMGAPLSLGMGVVLVAWMGLATYRRYGSREAASPM